MAYFVTLFKKPGKLLIAFTLCGVLAALPVLYMGIGFLVGGIDSLTALNINIDWEKLDLKIFQQLVMPQILLVTLVFGPIFLVLKAIYVLYKAFREKRAQA